MKSLGISIIIVMLFPKYFADSLSSHFLKIINLKKNSFNNSISFV